MICIQDSVLELGLRAQELHLYMQMIKVSDETGTVILKQQEFRDLIDVQDTRSIVAYLRALESHGLVYYVGRTDRVNTYKLNNKFYFK
ncbi:Uncharacterised protein [uncultured Clostridium sp.]|nr:Uncharacterised protein [uncultured Clostridium sp.]